MESQLEARRVLEDKADRKPGELSGDSEMGTFRGKQAPLIINSTYEAIRSTDKQKYQITPKRIYTDSENDYNGYMANIVGPGSYEGDELTAELAAKCTNGCYDLSGQETNVNPVESAEIEDFGLKGVSLELLMKPIDELEFSARAHNCLINADIRRVIDLVNFTEDEGLKIKNFLYFLSSLYLLNS